MAWHIKLLAKIIKRPAERRSDLITARPLHADEVGSVIKSEVAVPFCGAPFRVVLHRYVAAPAFAVNIASSSQL